MNGTKASRSAGLGECDLLVKPAARRFGKASLWAAAGPALAESAAAVLEQLSKVKAELASVKGATPSPGSGKIETKTDTKKYEGPDGVHQFHHRPGTCCWLKEY